MHLSLWLSTVNTQRPSQSHCVQTWHIFPPAYIKHCANLFGLPRREAREDIAKLMWMYIVCGLFVLATNCYEIANRSKDNTEWASIKSVWRVTQKNRGHLLPVNDSVGMKMTQGQSNLTQVKAVNKREDWIITHSLHSEMNYGYLGYEKVKSDHCHM